MTPSFHRTKPLHLGDATIDSVVDIDPFALPLTMLLPDADPARLAPHRSWLEPLHMAGDQVFLTVQTSVVRAGGKVILVDTCVGEHKQRPLRPHWHERSDTGYLERLAGLGLVPEQIDMVLCTHLHADHVGWNTVLRDGRWVPTFPNARYIVGRTEMAYWDAANKTATEPLGHGSFVDSVLPVVAHGQIDLVEESHELAPGCCLLPLPGHTPGQVGLVLAGGGAEALLVGDAIHHPTQLIAPEWSSGFCTDRGLSAVTRRAFLERVCETNAWLVPAHFRAPTACRLRRDGTGFLPEFALLRHPSRSEVILASPALKAAIAAKSFVSAPGVYDLISALIADRMGFAALYVTGYGTVASYLGLPDAGLATYRDMIERIERIVAMTKTPVIADADTGYGGLLNVRHTVRGYEAAGVSAIQIEDQEFPKKCGHTPMRRVVPLEQMVRKIEVAVDSKSSADFLVIARTDARTSLGLDEALRRGEAYAKAGADIIFIESPESEEELARVGRAIDKPLLANMATGGRTPMLSASRLEDLGFALAIFPAIGFLATGAALQSAYAEIKDHGVSTGKTPFYSFTEFNKLLGFEDIWAFEKRYEDAV